jgi:ribosomal protein S18 acetylase RimI-like enzyme
MLNKENDVTIVELAKTDAYLIEISSKYSSTHYYDVSVFRSIESWRIELIRKPFEIRQEKNYRGRFFEDHISEPRVFAAMLGKMQVGWIELGYDAWNNRMRVWEFLVQEEFRKQGIGTLLMNHGVKVAKERGARMLVLETQTNNANAIDFYMNFGFELIGFDLAAYSNEDTNKKEVRLELGLKLT